MFFPIRRTAALLILLPLGAAAQQASNPADATLAAPCTPYVSAFEDYLPTQNDKTTADQVWLSANRDVMPQQSQAGHEHGTSARPPVSDGAAREAGAARAEHAPAAHQHNERGDQSGHGSHAHGAH